MMYALINQNSEMLRAIMTDSFQSRLSDAKIIYSNCDPYDIEDISLGKPTVSKIIVSSVICQ